MEVSSEISQKIRSAIKAKLLELGAYVDDELPDYIMVMVANKRSRVQMKADLGLFLGVNTDPFTGWLHALLGKLQTIKADSDKAEDKQGNAEMLSAVKDKMGKLQKVGKVVKRRKKIINKVVGDEGLGLIMAKTVTTSDRKIGDTQQTLQIQSGNSGVESEEFVTNDTSTCRENQIGNGKSKIFQDSKIVRQFSFSQASGDELAEKLQTTNTEIVNSRTVAVVGITKPTAVFANVDIKGVNKSSTGQYSSSHRKVQSSALIRKRRASTSVLDRVSKAEDEVYDPCNPAVCAVAARKFKTSSSLLQVDRQTDNNASEGRMFDSQTAFQGEYGQPPQKLLKLSDTVHLEDIKQALAEVLEKTQARNDDDVAYFSRMMESSLRKLHPQDLSLAKLRIQQILFEFESMATQENIVENKQNANILEHTSYPNQNSKCNSVSTYFHTVDNTTSISMSGDRRTTFSSPHTPPGSPPGHDANQNSDDQTEPLAASDQQIDHVDNQQQRISSSINENHIAAKYDCESSERRTHFESSASQIDRIIFHPKSTMESLKSSRTYDRYSTPERESKTHSRLMVKSREKEDALVKPHKGYQQLQSPISLGKVDMESPNSVHSSPISNTSGLNIRLHVTSASRESTLSPHDLQPKPGASHIHKSKSSSAKNKPPPSILVDSIHNRKRLESVESASVLKQNWQRDKSPRAADPTKSDTQDSPKHYGAEALKVMAKNLKITVINKRAVKSHQESSSDDSDDDDDDFDSSDNEDDEEDEEKTKDEATLNNTITGLLSRTPINLCQSNHSYFYRALLLKAMTEAEHSIAVKRKVAVMRAMVCDNSPAEVYSPKRMQSEQSSPEESPPPYIPSRKDSISQSSSSCVLELNVAKSLQDDDSDYRPCQDDCRELISRYRHEGLLRTIGFDHGLGLSPHSESLKSHDRSRQWQEKSKNFTCERVVKSNNSSKSVHNFKITTNVVSAELQSVSGTKTHQHLPPLEQALQVTVSPNKESRISITSRLGKLVVERADSSECMQLKSDATSKVDYSKSDVKCRDGGDNSTTQRGQSKFKESNLFKGSNVTKFDAVIPSLGTVMAVQNQTKIAFVSRGKASVGEKTNIHVRHDRVGQPAVCVQRGGEEYVVDAIISKRDKADNAIQSGQSQEKLCVVDYESSDEEADDLAKMIDKEPRHDLYDSTTQNNELPLDLFVDSSTATKDKDIKTGLKRHENIEEKRSGTRFIVTLDGVDERQFDSKVSCNVLQKGKTSSASAPVKVAELYHSEQAQQKLFLDLLAVQAGRESQTLLQQMKGVIPAANILTPSLLTHALPIIDKSNKEFDDKQERAYTSRQGYCYPTKHVTYAETGVSAIKRAKMMERCKFWPACLAGPSCEYHHPTTRCKLFPNCKFGNKCLFIHPNCRFDSKCARADCPYTHTGHQATLASAAHVIAIPPPNCMFSPTPHKQHNLEFSYPASETTCRYFPNCQNINCPFVHPKPCKFGLLCKSPACQFYHPHKSHGQDRHKWQSHFDTAKPYMTTLLATVKVGSIFPRIPTPNRSSHSTTVSSTSH